MCNMQMGTDYEQLPIDEYARNLSFLELNQNLCSTQDSSPTLYDQMDFRYWPEHLRYEKGNYQSLSGSNQKNPCAQSPVQQPTPTTLWPSMLTTSANISAPQPSLPSCPAPTNKGMAPKPRRISTPRKTLTDNDRRSMCLFQLEHPSVTQTYIGAKFGVERSTVSKVLSKRKKYLSTRNFSSTPVRRNRAKFPDIERALSMWAQKSKEQGVNLSDEDIMSKAQVFSSTVGLDDSNFKIISPNWLEKFKQKNKIGSTSSVRRGSEIRPNAVIPQPNMQSTSASGTSCVISSSPPPPYEDLSRKSYYSANITNSDEDYCEKSRPSFCCSPGYPEPLLSDQSSSSNFIKQISAQILPKIETNSAQFCSHTSHDPLLNNYLTPDSLSTTESPSFDFPSTYSIDTTLPRSSLLPENYSSAFLPISTSTIANQFSHSESLIPCSPTKMDAINALETLLKFLSQSSNGELANNEYFTAVHLMQKIRSYKDGDDTSGEPQHINI